MKKIYYKIELRIGEWVLHEEDVEYGELYYFSDGYMIFTGNSLEGYLTNDILYGDIGENHELYFELLDYDDEKKFLSFSGHFEDIELPGAYTLACLSEHGKFGAIKFVEKVKDSVKKKEIEQELKRVKQIYSIP